MSRTGGLLSRLFRGLTAASKQNTRLVGEDHLGNRYYEKDVDTKNNRRAARWVVPRGKNADDPTFVPEVPTEWDSWLRRRRDRPPTQEELDQNYALMLRTQHRAKELQEQEEGMAGDGSTESNAKYTETVTQDSFKSKFPEYEDLESRPGQFMSSDKTGNDSR